MNTPIIELDKPLREGEMPTVTPVEDSTSGQPMALVTASRIPRSQYLPPRRAVRLEDYFDEIYAEVKLGRDGVSGCDAALLIARNAAWRYPELAAFVVAWEDLHCASLHPSRPPGIAVSFEEACDMAQLPYDELVGLLSKAAYWYGVERARQLLHAGLPSVVAAAQESAIIPGKEGHPDRKLLFQAGGLVQESQGTTVNVNQTTNVAAIVGLPKWEDSDKLLQGGS